MCIDILRNPVVALAKAKKQKNMNKTWLTLIEASILFALATGIVILKGGAFSQFAMSLAVVSIVSVFFVILVISIVLGYILKIIANTLGGSGKYYEGLTVISYTLIPISSALFVASILSIIPVIGLLLNILVVAVGFASGISLLYRGIKEMFRTDMVISLVAVSVLIIVLFISASISFGLSALTNLSSFIPLGA